MKSIFPAGGDVAAYHGHILSLHLFVMMTVIGTGRSLVHIFKRDGGANSIAGIPLQGVSGENIVSLFGQWGSSQLLLAVIHWIVILVYPGLVPLMLATVILEQLLRLGVGRLKPLQVPRPPPGAYGTKLLLPVACVALYFSLLPET
jgi:hypothetical protein